LDKSDLRRPERLKNLWNRFCLAQRSMLVEEALIGPLPFSQEQMSEMGQKRRFERRPITSGLHPRADVVFKLEKLQKHHNGAARPKGCPG
jgi:hypothetical protein